MPHVQREGNYFVSVIAPPRQPSYVILIVTPEQAKEWLSRNTHNRKIDQRHVKRLVADLVAGRWKFNPDPLSFSPGGMVLNGQHRLTAIVESGIAAQVAVCFDVPDDSMSVMDQGKPRGLKDIANLSSRTAAVTRVMFYGFEPGSWCSRQELAAFYRKFSDEIDFAVHICAAKTKGLRISAIPAVIARAACGHIQHQILEDFASVFVSGMPVAGRDEDATIIRLREKLIQARGVYGTTREHDAYASTERALAAFSCGQVLGKIYPVKDELFPLPER